MIQPYLKLERDASTVLGQLVDVEQGGLVVLLKPLLLVCQLLRLPHHRLVHQLQAQRSDGVGGRG